jgi:hypothetical protein
LLLTAADNQYSMVSNYCMVSKAYILPFVYGDGREKQYKRLTITGCDCCSLLLLLYDVIKKPYNMQGYKSSHESVE